MSAGLPSWLTSALASQLEGRSRAPLAAAAEHLSAVYRDRGHSNDAIRDTTAALSYAVARMPATFAAAARVLSELARLDPAFMPTAVLDLGAGPGTATFAAQTVFGGSFSARLRESNPHMRALAETLMAASPLAATTVVQSVDLLERTEPTQSEADLVLLGYVLAEHDVAAVAHLIGRALMSTRRYLAVVEPGTPSGFARIRAARTALTTAGAAIVAPCPHDHACPLPPEDWCHFTVRLPRSKDHRLLKGADAPFEDEPFSYVVAAVGAGVPPRIDARLLRPPIVTKAAAFLALCTRDGLADRSISRRNKAGYKAAGNLSAGDTVPAELLDLRSPP